MDSIVYQDKWLTVAMADRFVSCGGRRVPMGKLQFRLLLRLICDAGQLVRHRDLVADVWALADGMDDPSILNTVHANIYCLRQKIEPQPECPRYILSRRGLGYQFVPRGGNHGR